MPPIHSVPNYVTKTEHPWGHQNSHRSLTLSLADSVFWIRWQYMPSPPKLNYLSQCQYKTCGLIVHQLVQNMWWEIQGERERELTLSQFLYTVVIKKITNARNSAAVQKYPIFRHQPHHLGIAGPSTDVSRS